MLKIEGLHASYGGSLILQGVDLSVQKGELKALMGRNGMGKTTLFKTIMGLVPARSGSVLLEGKNLQGLRTHEIAAAGIGYVPQGREIFNNFTVWENLRLGLLRNSRDKREIPDEVFDYFPILRERKNQKAGSFSGGEQQMLAIARALVGSPKLLLLDEPSEGIQPSIVDEICKILRKINREAGLTILIVEQNVDMLLNLADNCAFMEKGLVVETCCIQDVKDDPLIMTRHMTVS